jgi:hypothetical protein
MYNPATVAGFQITRRINMAAITPFSPHAGSGVALISTGASVSLTASQDIDAKSVRFVNAGLNIAFVRIGITAGGFTASAADTPILPNTSLILTKSELMDSVAVFAPVSATVYLQFGEGGI